MEKESGAARSFDPPFPVPLSQHFRIPKFCHLDPEYHFLFKYHIPCKFGECWPNNRVKSLISSRELRGGETGETLAFDKTGLDLTGHFKKKKIDEYNIFTGNSFLTTIIDLSNRAWVACAPLVNLNCNWVKSGFEKKPRWRLIMAPLFNFKSDAQGFCKNADGLSFQWFINLWII